MTVYKVESTDFDVCCMNGIHNKIFFMQQHIMIKMGEYVVL